MTDFAFVIIGIICNYLVNFLQAVNIVPTSSSLTIQILVQKPGASTAHGGFQEMKNLKSNPRPIELYTHSNNAKYWFLCMLKSEKH